MQIDFYHLTVTPLERVLPTIAERVVASGERLLIVAGAEETRADLDRVLWSYTPDSFLPHAQTGGEHDADQPVLIAPTPEPTNGARHIALADGVWRDEALAFTRAFHLFGEDQIAAARTAWRALAGHEGVERRYWKQDGGKWGQVA